MLEWCNEGLQVEPDNTKLKEIRTKAMKEKVCQPTIQLCSYYTDLMYNRYNSG